MRTDLATIDREIGARVEQLKKDPPVPKRFEDLAQQKTSLGGFMVHDKQLAEHQRGLGRASVVAELERYGRDSATLTQSLKNRDVTPLAIVPSAAWRKICFDSGLIFITDSRVLLNTTHIKREIELAMNEAGRHTMFRRAGDADAKRRELAQRYVAGVPPLQLLRSLTFDGRSMLAVRPGRFLSDMDEGNHPGSYADLVLPSPPDDVIDTLCKVKELKPKTVAEPAAISFAPSLADILTSVTAPTVTMRMSPRNDEEARALGYESHEDWRQKCPIIYVEQESATAVVAQFGNFPIEKEVVERAIAGEVFEPMSDRPEPARSLLPSEVTRGVRDILLSSLMAQAGLAGTFYGPPGA